MNNFNGQNRGLLSCQIAAIPYHLPDYIIDNNELAQRCDVWSAEKILDKTRITTRRILKEKEFRC